MASCQKLGIILENKVILKLMLSKHVNNKKCVPKFVFINEKKIWKIPMIFDIENWLWKSSFGTFLTPPHYLQHQIEKFNVDFLPKISNSKSLPWKVNNPYYHNLGIVHKFSGKKHAKPNLEHDE